MTARVLSTVSVLVDLPFAAPHLPERGGDVLGVAGAPTPGGGFTVVAAAARQDVAAALVGLVGPGPYGMLAARCLAREGVAVLLTPEAPGPADANGATDTGLCVTITEPDGERTFLTAPGLEAHLTPGMLAAVRVHRKDVVVVSGYDLVNPGGRALAAWVTAVPDACVLLDPGPLVGEIDREVLLAVAHRADVLTLNERETRLLGGAAAVRHLVRPEATVLRRRGAAGCVLDTGTSAHTVPAPAVTTVDSTGAGDAHTGVLAAEVLRGTPLPEAVRRANVAGALTASRRGPATAPTRGEIDAHLARHGG
ncbi:sugar kinase [Miniimonas arenae]|uniref:Sugar kinase n=1 Tax=Miniimonas arenae TaxID=676201 RepID=A0A5C5BB34_9MICO|nr:PfkB family carbohydrate kinase [Miniimonas arenae]TNU73929.1 sugar kinase [Miniimonas arenae]